MKNNFDSYILLQDSWLVVRTSAYSKPICCCTRCSTNRSNVLLCTKSGDFEGQVSSRPRSDGTFHTQLFQTGLRYSLKLPNSVIRSSYGLRQLFNKSRWLKALELIKAWSRQTVHDLFRLSAYLYDEPNKVAYPNMRSQYAQSTLYTSLYFIYPYTGFITKPRQSFKASPLV